MLETVLFASVRFHDTTSRGRLLNRFGKDLEGVDSSLADNLGKTLIYGLNVSVTFISIAGEFEEIILDASCFGLSLFRSPSQMLTSSHSYPSAVGGIPFSVAAFCLGVLYYQVGKVYGQAPSLALTSTRR